MSQNQGFLQMVRLFILISAGIHPKCGTWDKQIRGVFPGAPLHRDRFMGRLEAELSAAQ